MCVRMFFFFFFRLGRQLATTNHRKCFVIVAVCNTAYVSHLYSRQQGQGGGGREGDAYLVQSTYFVQR